MNVLLVQLDGSLPNLALMRLAAFHRRRNHFITLRRSPFRQLGDEFDYVYGSAIFDYSAPRVKALREAFPEAIIGGSGSGSEVKVEDMVGLDAAGLDYSLYPKFTASIGFSQRGCRFGCDFCSVPQREGKVRPVSSIEAIWRGDPYQRHIHLLDNDFFGQPKPLWRSKIQEIQDGGFAICWNQGINVRVITDEIAEAIASVDLRDDGFREKRLYTAWDNYGERDMFLRGAEMLRRAGVPPSDLFVYMLVGFDPSETWERLLDRYATIRGMGAKAYPMVYVDKDHSKDRTLPLGDAPKRIAERGLTLRDFQRFAIRPPAKGITFADYDAKARGRPDPRQVDLFGEAA